MTYAKGGDSLTNKGLRSKTLGEARIRIDAMGGDCGGTSATHKYPDDNRGFRRLQCE